MNLLYCALRYNYAKQEEGLSYEAFNMEAGLRDCEKRNMFTMTSYYVDEAIHQYGKEKIGDVLAQVIKDNKIDIIMHVPFDDNYDVDLDVFRDAKNNGIIIMAFDPDSSWRQNFILPRKDFYTHFITTHSSAVKWYENNGMKVIKSQWGGSPLYYNLQPKKYKYDVSFVGQKHGIRSQIIQGLSIHGIGLHLFGSYWKGYPNNHGYISFDEIVEVFNTSRINLNFSNPFRNGTVHQIKGRHFEIPQCGGFHITTPCDDIESYFVPNKEIIIVHSAQEMATKIYYYLEHEKERETIAVAGYERMMKEHQWHHRMAHILEEIENG